MTANYSNNFQPSCIDFDFSQSKIIPQCVLSLHIVSIVMIANLISNWILSQQKDIPYINASLTSLHIHVMSIYFFYFSAHLTTWIYFSKSVELPKVIELHHFFKELGIAKDNWSNFILANNLKVFIAGQALPEGTHSHINARIYCFFKAFGTHWQIFFNKALEQKKVCFDYAQVNGIIESTKRERLENNDKQELLQKMRLSISDLMETKEKQGQRIADLMAAKEERDDIIDTKNWEISMLEPSKGIAKPNQTSKTKYDIALNQCFTCGLIFGEIFCEMITNPGNERKFITAQITNIFFKQLIKYPQMCDLHLKYTPNKQQEYTMYLSQYEKWNGALSDGMKKSKLMPDAVMWTVRDVLKNVNLIAGRGEK